MTPAAGRVIRLRLLGVGAMRSPRYAPAGLLFEYGGNRVMFDGGPGAAPDPGCSLDAWLVTDLRSELIVAIRRLAARHSEKPEMSSLRFEGVDIELRPVAHTSHPTCGYLIAVGHRRIAWAPEFWRFPDWAEDVDLLFADGAGWRHPIRFAGGVGGHASALDTAIRASHCGVRRLVFSHIGRPTIKAIDAGERLPFGEFGHDGAEYCLTA